MPTLSPEARAVEFARALDMMAAAAPDDHELEYTLRQIGEMLGDADSIADALAAHLDRVAERVRDDWPVPAGHWADWSAGQCIEHEAREVEARTEAERAADDWLQRAVRLIAPHREQVAA